MKYITKKEFEKNFWSKVNKTDTCWLWTGSKAVGYGFTYFNKKRFYTHRFSWESKYGKIQKGLFICHKCDNPSCVNPDHLFLGTQKDNLMDMVSKNRGGRQKLTVKQVKEIRKRYDKGNVTQTFLGRLFGVRQTTISMLTTRNTFVNII